MVSTRRPRRISSLLIVFAIAAEFRRCGLRDTLFAFLPHRPPSVGFPRFLRTHRNVLDGVSSSSQGSAAHGLARLLDSSFTWVCDDAPYHIGMTVSESDVAQGPSVLLLPALSSISTRREMEDLQRALTDSGFATVAVDWPGLGDSAKPATAWSPAMYEAFLLHVLTRVVPSPSLVVAAGHAAGYLLRVSSISPDCFGRAVLVAPTWRGPVPTMLNGRRPTWLEGIRQLVDMPYLGQMFYRLNLNDFVVDLMARRHVYSDAQWLSGNEPRMESKRAVTGADGARHASIRFVTGALDPFESAAPFVAAAEALGERLLVIYGDETPQRSRNEVDALTSVLPESQAIELPRGRLGVHEEFPSEVAAAIVDFR